MREILVPTVTRANLELEGERVVVRLDLNLAQESTNHPHADFWLAEVGQEHNRCGARYSLNVIAGRDVWLYKPGAPGVALGSIGQCGPEQIERLLAQATEEFAQSMGARA